MILLVDDIPENLLSLSSHLKAHNYAVETALSGEDALKKALKQPFELIILDVQMPGMDGFEVAEALLGYSKTKKIPIIFLSANYKDTSFIKKGYQSGGTDYITKPVDIDVLLLKIGAVCKAQEQLRKLSKMKDQLEKEVEKRKLAEKKKDELLTVASHELKTPLTSIRGYHELARRSLGKDDNESRKYLDREAVQISKLSLLVNGLLDYSAIENGMMKVSKSSFGILAVVNDAIRLVQDLFPGYRIIKAGMADVSIYADRLRIEQVVTSYLSNAVKYSPDHKEVIVTLAVSAGRFIFSVKDKGIGISAAKTRQIFDKLYRADDHFFRFQGMGIGLYICHKIIKSHQGKCWVSSEEGKGSEFFFSIPLGMTE